MSTHNSWGLHWSWKSACFLCYPSGRCTVGCTVESIFELFHLYPFMLVSQGLKVHCKPSSLQIITWDMVFMSGLETFCRSFSPTLGLSSCVAGVVHFLKSMTDLHLQHLFQTKLAFPYRSLHLTGPVNKMSILWNGSAEKCHVKQDNKFTCKHFRHTCIKNSISIFHHF